MVENTLSRRGFLGHVAGSYIATTMIAGTALAVSDPMLDLVRAYTAERNRMNSQTNISDDELENGFPVFDSLSKKLKAEPPAITSEAGAIAALRLATEELSESFGNEDIPLLQAALTFFETRALSA